jgi:peptidyl-prolyl cis-trans isomerase SurA
VNRLSFVTGFGLLLSTGSLMAACGGGQAKASSPDVWAVVNGHEIHQDDVVKTYRREAQNPPASTTDDEALMAEMTVVDEMITRELLLARARDLKLDVTDADVDAAYTQRRANMADSEFQLALAARSVTVDDLRAAIRRDLIAQKVLDQDVGARIDVTDREISDYFSSHRAEFNVPEAQYHIAQILVTPVREAQTRNRKNDDASTPDEARKKFEMLKAKLASGAPFPDVAADYSEDPQSAPQGGDLGFVSATQLTRVPPALRDAVLKTEPGHVGVATQDGAFAIVAVIAKEPAGQRELSSQGVHDTIKNNLHGRQEQLLRTAYLTDMRGHATIVNYAAKRILDSHAVKPGGLTPNAPGK